MAKIQPCARFLVKYNKRRFRIPELFTIFAVELGLEFSHVRNS